MVRRIVSLHCNCKCKFAWILLLDRIDNVGWNGMEWHEMGWDVIEYISGAKHLLKM